MLRMVFWVAFRYLGWKEKSPYVLLVGMVSLIGIALGVSVLIVSLSVMHGFESTLKEKILGTYPHAYVTGKGSTLKPNDKLLDVVKSYPEVEKASWYIKKRGLISHKNSIEGVLIQGANPEDMASIEDHIVEGSLKALQDDAYRIAIGKELSLKYGIGVGDTITVVSPTLVRAAGVNLPKFRRFVVGAVFATGMHEYDYNFAFVSLDVAMKLFATKGLVDGVRIHFRDPFAAPLESARLENALKDAGFSNAIVYDWSHFNQSFFQAMRAERVMMSVVLFSIILVAIFNIITTTLMFVNDKRSDIAVLRTMGFSGVHVLLVFLVTALTIGFIGVVLGNVAGVLFASYVNEIVAFLESTFSFELFPSDVYFLSHLPVDFSLKRLLYIDVSVLVSTLVFSLYPAFRALKVEPSDVLRYE